MLNDIGLHSQVWNLFEENRLIEVVDPALGEYPQEQVLRYIKVALFCIQAAAARRPSMPQVEDMLSKPVQLNDEEITLPCYMEGDSENFIRNFRAKNSSSSQPKYSMMSTDTTIPFSSNQVTFTEISPR